MSCGCGNMGYSLGGSGERGDENALVTTIERFTADRFSAAGRFFTIGTRKNWNAIAIGSRSMFDRCFVMPMAQIQDPRAVSSLIDNLDMYMSQVVEVSVERPHIGHIEGPLIIAPGYSQNVNNGTRISAMVDQNSNTFIGADFTIAAVPDDRVVPHLDLAFYAKAPPFIPTKRAPWDYVAEFSQFGSTGTNTVIIQLPGWGRNRWHIALNFTIVGGSIDYRIDGIDMYSLSTGNASTITTPLVPVTTIAASGDFSHVVTEGFDIIRITATENAALSANSSFTALARGYD